jgi:hypothetical protein
MRSSLEMFVLLVLPTRSLRLRALQSQLLRYIVRFLFFAQMNCLPLVVLRSQVVSYGRNERMQLCEECDGPHDVHCGGREDEG